jgi:hypothetical protein
VSIGGAVAVVASAPAANSPAFRDCAFAGGVDPDFVQLLGATAGSNGALTVDSAKPAQVKASESSDPGDGSGHDTLKISVSGPGISNRTASGQGVGKVVVNVPLDGAQEGQSYTISWSATFDNGNHSCPSSQTPQNSSPRPFVVTESSGQTTTTTTTTSTTSTSRTTHHRHRKHHRRSRHRCTKRTHRCRRTHKR